MNQLLKRVPAVVRHCIAVMLCMTIVLISLFTGMSAMINRVKIIDSSFFKVIYTISTNPASILANAGIKLDGGDTYLMNWLNGREGELILKRALDVTVSYGDKTVTLSMPDATVGEAVDKAGFKLTDDMVLNCSVNDAITDGMKIEIYDIINDTVYKEIAIPFETVTVNSAKLDKGTTKTTVEGKDGVKKITYSCTIINGEIVSKTVVSEEIISEPVTRKITIGTKVDTKETASKPSKQPSSSSGSTSSDASSNNSSSGSTSSEDESIKVDGTPVEPDETESSTVYYTKAGYKYISTLTPSNDFKLDKNGIPVSYKKVITGKATAYSYSAGSLTATGRKVRPGYIAVNPKQIPYGTKMFIRSSDGKYIYGYASAEDTGGFVKGGKIIADLFFKTDSACYNFGVRNIEIYILN